MTSFSLPSQLIIGGESRAASDGSTFEVFNPATGASIGSVSQGGQRDLEDALAAATRAFNSGVWSTVSATDRGHVLLRVAQLIRDRSEEFAQLEVLNAGHTIDDAR
jgi:acyl-CoA reductase-like NAD-dependent aldehyde dehydrogenase